MSKVTLYIATSQDGFIAREDGSIDWLEQEDIFNDEEDYGYSAFLETVDCTIMGRKTYEQVLGFEGEFPYKNKENFVFSKNENLNPEYAKLISNDIETFYNEHIKNSNKHFWLVGGAGINTLFLHNNWIDKIIITVTPIKLGTGIPLFNDEKGRENLHLEKTLRFNKGWIQYYFAKTL